MNNMMRIVGWQAVIAGVLAVVAVLLGGQNAGISAALGGVVCVVPNLLFAIGLRIMEQRKKQVGMGMFLVLEFVKIVVTMAFMIAAAWFYRDVSWAYFLISLGIVLNSYIFLLYKNRS